MGFFPRDSGRIMTLPVILDAHLQNYMIINLYCFKPLNLVDWVQPYYYKQEHELCSGNLKFLFNLSNKEGWESVGHVRHSCRSVGAFGGMFLFFFLEVCFMQPSRGSPSRLSPNCPQYSLATLLLTCLATLPSSFLDYFWDKPLAS